MILFDIRQIARNLATYAHLDNSVREVLALRVIGTAAEIFNFNDREGYLLAEAEELFENDYEVMGVASLIDGFVKEIRKGANRCSWDPRIKVKVERRQVGAGFHQARVVMDLEETMAWMIYEANLVVSTDSSHVTDIVVDNPDPGLIDEVIKLQTRKTERRVPVLSDRHPRAIEGNSRSGRGDGHWERYGDKEREAFCSRGPTEPSKETRLNSALGAAEDD